MAAAKNKSKALDATKSEATVVDEATGEEEQVEIADPATSIQISSVTPKQEIDSRTENPVPSVGRVVHYVDEPEKKDDEPAHYPATVIVAPKPEADGTIPVMVVAMPDNDIRRKNVPYDAEKGLHTWHWPELT